MVGDCVITQASLFYTYSGDCEAKKGSYAPIGSIREEMLALIWSHIDSQFPSKENHTEKGSSSQERKHLSEKEGNNKAEKENETSLEMLFSSAIGKKPNINYNKNFKIILMDLEEGWNFIDILTVNMREYSFVQSV